jgi:UDP-3-O-[3-hydroxymyristoyl] glucosamine N-acyltransferase
MAPRRTGKNDGAGVKTATALAALVDGVVHGPDRPFSGVAPLARAGADDLAFADGPLPSDCEAGVLLVRAPIDGRCCVVVPSPRRAFAAALRALFPEVHEPGVHPGAVVHPSAKLGKGVVIYPGVHVGADCDIGDHSVIFPNAVLYPGVILGPQARVHAGAVLGADGFSYEAGDTGPEKVPQLGGLRVGARVEVGANACVDRGALDDTVVGDDCKLDDLVLVAHNVRLGRGVVVAGQAGLAGSATVGDGALLGGQAGVSDHAEIGAGARIGAGAGVVGPVPGGETWLGRPAAPARRMRRVWAVVRQLPELWRSQATVEARLERLERRLDADEDGNADG